MRAQSLLCLGAVVVLAVACRQTPNGQTPATSRVVLPRTADPRPASIQLRVVDPEALGQALVAIARTTGLTGEIPAALYDPFIAALPPADNAASLTVDADGGVSVPLLSPQQVVVVQTAQRLWVVPGSEIQNGTLQLTEANAGGERALAVARALPAVTQALTAAADAALGRGQFHEARSLARTVPDDSLVERVNRAEVDALLAQAEEAFGRQDYDAARRLAMRADAIVPQDAAIRSLLARVLVEQGGEQAVQTAHQGAVAGLAFTADGRHVVSAGADGVVRVGDAKDGRTVRSMKSRRGPLTCLAISPDDRWVVAGSASGALQVWNLDDGADLAATDGLGWAIRAVAVSPDGAAVLTAGDDARVRLWRASPLQQTLVLNGHGWRVTSAGFVPGGQRAVTGSEDDTARVWDVTTGDQLLVLRHGYADVNCLAISPDGRTVLAGGAKQSLTLWNLDDGRDEAVLATGRPGPVRVVALASTGRYGLSGGDDGVLQIWDLPTRTLARSYAAHDDGLRGLAISPDGRRAATAGTDGTVKLWQLPRAIWPPEPVAAR